MFGENKRHIPEYKEIHDIAPMIWDAFSVHQRQEEYALILLRRNLTQDEENSMETARVNFSNKHFKSIEQITKNEILIFFDKQIKPFFKKTGLEYNALLIRIKNELNFYNKTTEPDYKKLRFKLLNILNDIIESPVFSEHFINKQDKQVYFNFLFSFYLNLDKNRCASGLEEDLKMFKMHVKLVETLINNFKEELNILDQSQKNALFQQMLESAWFYSDTETEFKALEDLWKERVKKTILSIRKCLENDLSENKLKSPENVGLFASVSTKQACASSNNNSADDTDADNHHPSFCLVS